MSTPPSRRQSWANVSLAQATGLAPMLVNTNPASLVLEGFWAAIAIFGLVRAWLARGEQPQ